jgi:hypothetical protein
MKRRSFIQASVAGISAMAAGGPTVATAAGESQREIYELRTYSLKTVKIPLLDDYLKNAFMPVLKRRGFGPVGVFVEQIGPENVKTHVLLVHPRIESVSTLATQMSADGEYQKSAAAYLAATASDPIYERIDSSLLTAIVGMPKMELPNPTQPRLFNLRIYESHNERASRKKIEMFNEGELAIFKRVGLTPVFFAETILGSAMPNLTYLLVFPDDPGLKAAWGRFRTDPEWLKLKAIPEYADKEIVSKVTNRLLTPASYSEV